MKYDLSKENLKKLGYKKSKESGYFKTKSEVRYRDKCRVDLITTTLFAKDNEITFEGCEKFKEELLKELEIK